MRLYKHLSTVFILVISFMTLTVSAEMQHGAAEMQPAKNSDIQAHMGWVRAVPPVSTNTAAYMMLHNYSEQDDRILSIESSAAAAAEMHSSKMNDGVMEMIKLDEVMVPAKGHVMFEPAGHHIMLINLKEPLKVGAMVPFTLVFEKHGRIDIQLIVSHPPENNQKNDAKMKHSGHDMTY